MISSLGAGNIVASTIFPLAAIVSLVLRLRARHSGVGSWFIDDYMIIVALLEYADGLVMIVSSTFTKLSIVYLYRRVLPPYKKSIPTIALLVVLYAWGVAYLATDLFSCIPISSRWDSSNPGYCYSTDREDEAFDISNLVINFLILLRPITQLREFRLLSPRMKAWIGGSISLEAIVDASYNLAKLSLLSQLEASLFVICACVLSLASSHPISSLEEKKEEEGRYEKPELAADDIPRQMGELDSAAIVELPVPDAELAGNEQFHQLDDTSTNRSRERV
ncbi:hypothetical protein EKO27_g11617 [Xylaria grammica]|uniref:Rhodopsin domain-containing protein n=1 Tax=Xylaria grammica TaxID=363999 RepID=A0A439CMU7_9PEZI|nr:hypothetical protein EKO27_g11617 [Xylaria grammica]